MPAWRGRGHAASIQPSLPPRVPQPPPPPPPMMRRRSARDTAATAPAGRWEDAGKGSTGRVWCASHRRSARADWQDACLAMPGGRRVADDNGQPTGPVPPSHAERSNPCIPPGMCMSANRWSVQRTPLRATTSTLAARPAGCSIRPPSRPHSHQPRPARPQSYSSPASIDLPLPMLSSSVSPAFEYAQIQRSIPSPRSSPARAPQSAPLPWHSSSARAKPLASTHTQHASLPSNILPPSISPHLRTRPLAADSSSRPSARISSSSRPAVAPAMLPGPRPGFGEGKRRKPRPVRHYSVASS